MRGPFTPGAKVIHRSHQSLPEVMLPDAVHDDPRQKRAGAMLDIRHPLRQRTPLLGRIGTPLLSPGHRPIVRGAFASAEHAQESQLKWLGLDTKVASAQEPRWARFGTKIGEGQRGG